MSAATSIERFAPAVLQWFDRAGRKHLPWQQQRTPYRVWVSEIMLQQTQVATVVPFFERFMQRFADVRQLAAAPLDEVLHLWTGLGYYARARNLQRAAQVLVQQHGGEFPHTHAEVQALPGIGRSTAAAILALAREQRHAILDGNVKRVLSRYFAIHGDPTSKTVVAQLWSLAEVCTPHTRVADYTQAIMDLGATLCTRARPRCAQCPVASDCQANTQQLQVMLPARKAKRLRPQRQVFALVARNAAGATLLEKRPLSGIWGGLWVFPHFDSEADLHAWAQAHLGEATLLSALPIIDHAFTHFDLRLQPRLWSAEALAQVGDEPQRYYWYDPAHPARIGLAKPVLAILQSLTASRQA